MTVYTGINLAPLPAFYSDMNGAASSYASLDYSVLHNGNPSIRVGPDYVRWTREVDGPWVSIRPGDHIYMGCWIKTSVYTSTDPQAGGVFGFDLLCHASTDPYKYSIVDLGSDGNQAGHPTSAEMNISGGPNAFGHTINGESGLTQVAGLICRVPFNQDWTWVEFDFIVPSTYYTYVTNNDSFPDAIACNPVQIDAIVPWFTGRQLYDSGYIWFADPVFYINPAGGGGGGSGGNATLVQGPVRGTCNSSDTVTVTMVAPTNGNVLVATIGSHDASPTTITSITQTNVAWTLQVYKAEGGTGATAGEIWTGIVSGSPGTTATIVFASSVNEGVADITEWSGLDAASLIDQTATSYALSATLESGTTVNTAQANELAIAVLISGAYAIQTTPSNGFTLLDGALGPSSFFSLSQCYKQLSTIEAVSVSTQSGYAGTVGAIITLKILAVTKYDPTVPVPTLSEAVIIMGDSITASATISGAHGTPTGSITFMYSSDGGVGWIVMGTNKVLVAGAATSDSVVFAYVGTYLIKAAYSGDAAYNYLVGATSTLTVNEVPTNFVCPKTIISAFYDVTNSYDAATKIAKQLNKDFWSE